VLNVESICGSVVVSDAVVVADVGFISGVDPQPTATGFTLDVDPSFVKPEFMPEYKVAFGDECAQDSADHQPVPELISTWDKTLLQRALAQHAPEMPHFWDLSQAHRVVADGLQFDDNVPLINHDNIIIWMGIIFKTMETIKIWLAEYAVFHHRPFIVKHSDENKRYVITCRHGCPWTIHARKERMIVGGELVLSNLTLA
jgi:hypothetical protein